MITARVIVVLSTLVLLVAARDTRARNENLSTESSDTSMTPEGSMPAPQKRKPFFSLGGNWPYNFNDDSKTADHDQLEETIGSVGRMWSTVGGIIDLFKNPYGGKRNRTEPDSGDYDQNVKSTKPEKLKTKQKIGI